MSIAVRARIDAVLQISTVALSLILCSWKAWSLASKILRLNWVASVSSQAWTCHIGAGPVGIFASRHAGGRLQAEGW